MSTIRERRAFMKSPIGDTDIKAASDIAKGVPQPLFQKPISQDAVVIDLPEMNTETAPKADFYACTMSRISRRMYSDEPLSLFDMGFLLWCTQGLKKVIGG